MSTLGDIENAIVARLEQARIGGAPAFQTVHGLSGGYRAAVRDTVRRARMPAAFVAFAEEPTAPETNPSTRGARYVVLVVQRVLRLESDPRHGDDDSPGAFALVEKAREQLDGCEPLAGLLLVSVQVRFADADERTAMYELLYRVWPVPRTVLPPGAPSPLEAYADVVRREVKLSWREPGRSETAGEAVYYKLYRKRPSDTQFILQDAAAQGETSKTLTAQPTGLALQYYVTAANTGGEGPASNTVMVML